MDKIKVICKKIPWITIPIILVLGFIPLVVYYYPFKAQLSQMSWYSSIDDTSDLFNYYKGQLLIFVAVCMLIILIISMFLGKKTQLHKCLIALLVYALMIILSTMCTKYSYYSLNGMSDHFETVYVLLAYCMVTYFCYVFADSENKVKFIIYCWLFWIALMGIIGMFQLTGHDLYTTQLGKNLLLPENLEDTINISFNFEKGRVYLTLYNPNYVGFFATLTIPILTTLFIFLKKIFVKMIILVLNSVVFLCLMGSGARNGVIALSIALVIMIVFFRKKLKTHWIGFLIAYGSMIVLFITFNAFNDNKLADRLEAGLTIKEDSSKKLEDIQTNDDNITIIYGGETLIITQSLDTNGNTFLVFSDDKGLPVTVELVDSTTNSYKIVDERYPLNFSIGQVGKYNGFAIDIDGMRWCFTNQTEYPGYYYYSAYGRITKIEKAETAIFTNYSSLFSGRGHLWARTIPLLKDYLFIGSGPDTFTLVYPQKDYVAAAQRGFLGQIISKPHNLYLQIGVQTGVVSLLAYLALNIIYLLECIKLYFKSSAHTFGEYIGVAIMVAIIGYLISGIINDSTVTIAPVYWCLIGMGLAVNRLVKVHTN